jgi:hypothetical protein
LLRPFYERHGWVEIGRHRNALRFADGDDDEVAMTMDLAAWGPVRFSVV